MAPYSFVAVCTDETSFSNFVPSHMSARPFDEGLALEMSAIESLNDSQLTLSAHFIKPNLHVSLPH